MIIIIIIIFNYNNNDHHHQHHNNNHHYHHQIFNQDNSAGLSLKPVTVIPVTAEYNNNTLYLERVAWNSRGN